MVQLRRALTALALGSMIFSTGPGAAAQPAPVAQDGPDAATRAALAAIVPGAEDLPVGFTFVGETFLTADQLAAGSLDAGALRDAGFVTQYVSVYEQPDAAMRIRSYASAWDDATAAEAGFQIVEDETVVSPDSALEDSDAAAGEDPRETTTGTYTAEDGIVVGTVDVTFRRDNVLAGVAIETTDGSAPDAAMAAELAALLDARVQTVQNGESPAHTDLALPAKVLSLAGSGQVMQAGFLGPVEVESIYGVQGSVLDSIAASWVESVRIGEPGVGPVVTIGLSSFGAPEDAAAAVEQSSEIFTPLADQEAIADVNIEGADVVQAYRYTGAGGDAVDSYRVIYASGASLIVVDVQGAPADTLAASAGLQIAVAQIGCLNEGTCEALVLPADLGGQ